LAEAEKQEASAAHDRMTAEKTLIESRKSVEELRADYAERKTGVLVRLLPLQITEIPDGGVSTLLESLKARLKEWQARILQKTVVEKQIAEFDSEIRRLDAVIDTQSNALAEKRERLESLKTEFAATKAERKELFGEKSPDEEELRLNKAISNAEDAERKARDRNDELRQKLSQATSRVESLNLRISQREPELKRVETEFFAALSPAGFLDEERFLDARMTAKLREELSSKAKFLDNSFTDLQARRKDRERRLTDELAKRVTDRPLEELKQLGTEQEDALKTHRDTMAGLKHKLKENTAARERLKEKQTVIEAQKIECRRWENLHELIGSENGKKYRNFAQGLTFDMMIGHANRQLQKMTDRYLLVRDDAQALELSVMDNYQAGEVRSAKNLSGGESFIVSLALALGLSQMASRNVRVDSLFLDEGFGTLDEDALDVALETLSGLQQDGKVIGVISHVPALKERIATQIQVIPRTGGRSGISGPGCGRMASRGQGS
jgi:exonuclease SbcC